MASQDLQELWKERANDDKFKQRDKAYGEHEKAFAASQDKQPGVGSAADLFPRMMDSAFAQPGQRKPKINIARQIVNHHTAAFSRMPRVWCVPQGDDQRQSAVHKTAVLQGVWRKSRMKSIQPRNAYWLSARGDALYGVEWRNQDEQKEILVRTYDPKWCYPDLDATDPGGLNDLLITYTVKKNWVRDVLHLEVDDDNPRLFILWDHEKRTVQVEEFKIPEWTVEHQLGFCPWRWVFNSSADQFAQSDIVDITGVQEVMADALKLALEAARKRIHKAYWGRGIAGQVVPEAGRVVSFANPQANIEEFPTADPPDMLFGVVNMLQGYAQAMGGISPISMEGMAGGSIVTGSAVRHQVEAIEARAESKRVNLEQAFSVLGEFVLRVLETHFKEDTVSFQTDQGAVEMRGEEVHSWYTCEASYGGFEGLSALDRGRWALEGLGRIHDVQKAVEIVYPEEDSSLMSNRLHDYQLAQARMTGESQATAQMAIQQLSEQQGGKPQPGQPPQPQPPPRMQPPPQPGASEVVRAAGGQPPRTLGEIQGLLNLLRTQLEGSVYAVGELALVGMSLQPEVVCEAEEDVPKVRSVLAPKRVQVLDRELSQDEPRITLL